MESKTELSTEPGQPAEDSGKALALKKLTLEIAELERPWWKRPTYILAALPTMLAFGTLLVAVFSGYFQAAYTKLENQKHDLEAQVKTFEEKRDDLSREYERTKRELEQTKDQLTKTQQGMAEAHAQIERFAQLLRVRTPEVTVALGELRAVR